MRALVLLIGVSLTAAAGVGGPAVSVASVASAASGRVSVAGKAVVIAADRHVADSSDVVVWLKPAGGVQSPAVDHARPHFKVVQHNKRFEPHQIVVPVGAVVDFPNLDPFFHNAFSLFDGKRFDLGLYEAGASRSVTFTRTGVCYIFCNIHPEMSAVILALDTPYYAVSNPAGDFAVANVPPGEYAMNVWHERHKLAEPDAFPRSMIVSDTNVSVGPIRLLEVPDLLPHKNKYGKDYPPPPGLIYKK